MDGDDQDVAPWSNRTSTMASSKVFATASGPFMERDYTSRMKLGSFRIFRVLIVAACAFTAMAEGTQTKQNASQYYARADLHDGASIGADFLGKYMRIQGTTIYSDEYVFVEVALFAPPGHHVQVKDGEFKLKINGTELPVQPAGAVTSTQGFLEMVPRPELLLDGNAADGTLEIGGRKSKAAHSDDRQQADGSAPPANQGTGGDGQQAEAEPTKNASAAVNAAVLHAGEYSVPVSGYLCFSFEGKLKKIKHAELVYSGPLGSATLKLK